MAAIPHSKVRAIPGRADRRTATENHPNYKLRDADRGARWVIVVGLLFWCAVWLWVAL
jgi:hypothetical protein